MKKKLASLVISIFIIASCSGAKVHLGLNTDGNKFTRDAVTGSVSPTEMQRIEEGDRRGELAEAEKNNLLLIENQLNAAYLAGDDEVINLLLSRKAQAAENSLSFTVKTSTIRKIVNPTPWRIVFTDGELSGIRISPNSTTTTDRKVAIGEGRTFNVRNLDTGREIPITRDINETTDTITFRIKRVK